MRSRIASAMAGAGPAVSLGAAPAPPPPFQTGEFRLEAGRSDEIVAACVISTLGQSEVSYAVGTITDIEWVF